MCPLTLVVSGEGGPLCWWQASGEMPHLHWWTIKKFLLTWVDHKEIPSYIGGQWKSAPLGWVYIYTNWMWIFLHTICMTVQPVHTPAFALNPEEGSFESLAHFSGLNSGKNSDLIQTLNGEAPCTPCCASRRTWCEPSLTLVVSEKYISLIFKGLHRCLYRRRLIDNFASIGTRKNASIPEVTLIGSGPPPVRTVPFPLGAGPPILTAHRLASLLHTSFLQL